MYNTREWEYFKNFGEPQREWNVSYEFRQLFLASDRGAHPLIIIPFGHCEKFNEPELLGLFRSNIVN